jgi:hypothetical protein
MGTGERVILTLVSREVVSFEGGRGAADAEPGPTPVGKSPLPRGGASRQPLTVTGHLIDPKEVPASNSMTRQRQFVYSSRRNR